MRKLFELLDRLNHSIKPNYSKDKFRLDAKVAHKETINTVLTNSGGRKIRNG